MTHTSAGSYILPGDQESDRFRIGSILETEGELMSGQARAATVEEPSVKKCLHDLAVSATAPAGSCSWKGRTAAFSDKEGRTGSQKSSQVYSVVRLFLWVAVVEFLRRFF